jgi:Asp-tRNA(Asn)/Glu-tRNA(Gln) amidotransferase A subunit family amidase
MFMHTIWRFQGVGDMDLWQLDAAQASALMAQGELCSEDLTRACLDRIAAREPVLKAWAHLDPEGALAQARARDREPRRGPLHGIPVGIKDVIRTADLPTTFHSPVYAGHRPNEDAHAVAVLRALGAVILGKTHTLEFACGGAFPPTCNPWDPQRTPGGSSSGSGAAVADGMVPLALGTQTGGSTIRPAAFCGVYGMKPTWGRIPFDGIKSYSPALDTVGLYGRSAGDLRLLLQAYALDDAGDALPRSPAQLRLGVCRTPYWAEADAQAQSAFDEALARLRQAGVVLVELPWPEGCEDINRWQDEVMQDGGRYAFWPERLNHPQLLHADFQAKLDNHLGLTPERMRRATDGIARCRAAFEELLSGLDGALGLSAPGPAPIGLHTQGMATFNRMWTALQVPCIGIPALWTAQGLPMGLQLIGRRYDDAALLAVAQALGTVLDTRRTPWN